MIAQLKSKTYHELMKKKVWQNGLLFSFTSRSIDPDIVFVASLSGVVLSIFLSMKSVHLVNFTNLMTQSANAPVDILWHLWHHSVSPTKIGLILLKCTARKSTQLLCTMLYPVRQQDRRKPTGAKAAGRTLMKLIPKL